MSLWPFSAPPPVDLSHSPATTRSLLSHYLFWVMLLPFALAHKDRDDGLLLQAGNRLSLRRHQQQQHDGGQAGFPHTT